MGQKEWDDMEGWTPGLIRRGEEKPNSQTVLSGGKTMGRWGGGGGSVKINLPRNSNLVGVECAEKIK